MKYVIVANRLPYSVGKDLKFKRSPGGLASGLITFFNKAGIEDYLWIGWPGKEITRSKIKEILPEARRLKTYPVFIPPKHFAYYYEGFSNKTLWPLFHNFSSYAIFDKKFWSSYVYVNQLFFEELKHFIDDETIVWVHDYHLMLLPRIIRENFPDVSIGFFLHIPFPPPEIFMQLPWRKELLEGLLGADLIGFHTYEYTNNFLKCLSRTLGLEHKLGKFFYDNRYIKADSFPMGIDFELYHSAGEKRQVKSFVKKLLKTFKGKKIIFSVDRLDYTKGIYNRLIAFEELLNKHPEFIEKVVLIIVVVPSREGVEHYQRMKKQLEEKIAEINGKYSRLGWTPVHYYYRFLEFDELVSHYIASDAIMVTPLKDGMNLVAKEFVAARKDKKGVLILSEFAGSAKELGEALIVNPNSIDDMVEALKTALTMDEEEQKQKIETMQNRLRRYDIVKWGFDFLETLKKLKEEKEKLQTKMVTSSLLKKFKQQFEEAKEKIIFLDYDGTLVPIVANPSLANPDAQVLALIGKLSKTPNLEVVLISGRRREFLERWFGKFNINLVAEHGAFIKKKNEDWQVMVNFPENLKEQIYNIMEPYVDRLPGAFIEVKDFSLVFHYRSCDPELANLRVTELIDELLSFTANVEANILLGNKVVEVRPSGADKGAAARKFLETKDFEFIMAFGDDTTDEELFKALPEKSITIKVGLSQSFAKFSVLSFKDVRSMLKYLIE